MKQVCLVWYLEGVRSSFEKRVSWLVELLSSNLASQATSRSNDRWVQWLLSLVTIQSGDNLVWWLFSLVTTKSGEWFSLVSCRIILITLSNKVSAHSLFFLFSPESFRKDIFPTRLFGSVEKIDEFFLNDADVGESVDNNSDKSSRRSRCESLGAKDSKKIRDAIRRANMTSQIKNRRFRVESCDK